MNKFNVTWCTISMVLGLMASVSPGATVLNVDFDQTGVPDDLQSGFEAFVFDGTATHTNTYPSDQATDGDVDVTIAGATHYRSYYTLTGGPFVGLSHLLRDMVLRNANGTLTLTLGDLKASTYEITMYHHSTQYGGGSFTVNLTDSVVTGEQQFSGTVSAGRTPDAVTSHSFTFVSDGSSDVVIDLIGGANSQHLSFNGFELTAILSTEQALTVGSAYGTPDPAVGTHYYTTGTVINASVDALVTNTGVVVYECTGW